MIDRLTETDKSFIRAAENRLENYQLFFTTSTQSFMIIFFVEKKNKTALENAFLVCKKKRTSEIISMKSQSDCEEEITRLKDDIEQHKQNNRNV